MTLSTFYFAHCSQIQLRPNAYYELTDGCELVFADVRCQYFYGAPADQLGSGEQTQLYEFEEEGEERVGGGERVGEEEEQAGREEEGGGGEEVEGGGRREEVGGG